MAMSHPEQLDINPKYLEEYLLAIYRECPELNNGDLYLASYGSEISEASVLLRPMIIDAHTMIEESTNPLT